MPEETVTSSEQSMEAMFDQAAGIAPEPDDTKQEQPVQEKEVESTEKEQPEEKVPEQETPEKQEPVIDWQKRYKDLQPDHDRLLAENKKYKSQMEEVNASLKTLKDGLATAENIEDIQAAMYAAEKAAGHLTFEGLDPKAAAIISGPINQLVDDLKSQITDLKSQIEGQSKIKDLESKYPYLKEHQDLVKETFDPLVDELNSSGDGDAFVMAVFNKAFELSDQLKSSKAQGKSAEAARNTPEAATTDQVSKPAKEPTEEEQAQKYLNDIFDAGSEKGTPFI